MRTTRCLAAKPVLVGLEGRDARTSPSRPRNHRSTCFRDEIGAGGFGPLQNQQKSAPPRRRAFFRDKTLFAERGLDGPVDAYDRLNASLAIRATFRDHVIVLVGENAALPAKTEGQETLDVSRGAEV